MDGASREFRVLSCENGVSIQGGDVKQVVLQHHGPSLCLVLAGVGASHLVHGVYTSFGLVVECSHFCFFLPAIFIHHFVVVHRAQKPNSPSFLSDVADHGKAAIESKLCAVNLSGLGSLHQMSGLFYHRVPTIV